MRLADNVALIRGRAPALITAALAILFVLQLSEFWTFVFIGGMVSAVVALSIGIVYGRTGMVSLCQFSFAGIGAWAMGWLTVHSTLPFVVMLLLGGLAAVPFGLAIGLLSLRLRGVNLAVATLGFASAALVVLRRNPIPGSFANMPIGRPSGFTSENGYFLFCCLVFAFLVAGLAVISRTRIGRGWTAVRQSERATASLGLSVAWLKFASFSLGAFVAGIAGGLLAGQTGLVSNRSFEPFDSLLIFAVAVLAGARYVDGAIAAGLLGSVLPELFRKWGIPLDVAPMLFGVGTIVILSQGAEGAQGQLRARWQTFKAQRGSGRSTDQAHSIPTSTSTPTRTSSAGTPAAATLVSSESPSLGVDIGEDALRQATTELHGTAALELRGISVSYGAVIALDGVSLIVEPRTVHGLIGPNGAGKSTLVDTVTGFTTPTKGTIWLGDRKLNALAVHQRARAGIRRTFQQGRAIEGMAVGEYVEFAAGRGLTQRYVDDLLSFFACPRSDRRISSIDVATRRLVEVAGCFASDASIVLLDEPGAGLAADESEHLGRCIKDAPQQFGCGVLLIEHDMEIVRIACDHLTVLDFGLVIATGEPQEVLARDDVVAAYLGQPMATETR